MPWPVRQAEAATREGGIGLGIIGQAAGLFTVTNIDDIVLLAVFFAQATARNGSVARIVAGQYIGFVGIVAVAIAAALARWGHVVLPVALVGIGVVILVEGKALGLIELERLRRQPHGPPLRPIRATTPARERAGELDYRLCCMPRTMRISRTPPSTWAVPSATKPCLR